MKIEMNPSNLRELYWQYKDDDNLLVRALTLRWFFEWGILIFLEDDSGICSWKDLKNELKFNRDHKVRLLFTPLDRLYRELSKIHHMPQLFEAITSNTLQILESRFEDFFGQLLKLDLKHQPRNLTVQEAPKQHLEKPSRTAIILTYFILKQDWYGLGLVIEIPKMGIRYEHDVVLAKTLYHYSQKESWKRNGWWSNSRNIPKVALPYVESFAADTGDSKPKLSMIASSEKEMRIGEYVKTTFKNLHQSDQLTPAVLNRLLDRDSSKLTFKQSLPILIPKSDSPIDSKGHRRYYSTEIVTGFWLLSQWDVSHWDKFLAWEQSLTS